MNVLDLVQDFKVTVFPHKDYIELRFLRFILVLKMNDFSDFEMILSRF